MRTYSSKQKSSSNTDSATYRIKSGLNEDVVRKISKLKQEPDWMLAYRLKALEHFRAQPMPSGLNSCWFSMKPGVLDELDFTKITYYVKPKALRKDKWENVPSNIKETFDELGVTSAEKKYLAGVCAQYESEVVYHNLKQNLVKQGVIFCDTDTALHKYPDLFKTYFGKIIPHTDNKFAALNSAVWSGGSFIYVPPGVNCEIPLQAYFRINTEQMGQFERTLIIVDKDSFVHYIEGCTAPSYTASSLHSAVVEIVVKDGGRCRYTTIQNWAPNIYNLVTKRAIAHENAHMEWVDGNIGSRITMKYPAVILKGAGAKADILSIAVAGQGQHQDAGAKVLALAPNCRATILSKSISKGGGKVTYRGLASFGPKSFGSKANIKCDTLILDPNSASDTIPYNEVKNNQVNLEHEATVSKVSAEQLFYLMSRGLSEEAATQMIILGFIEPFTKELPMEYAVEMNRLIKMELTGAIG